MKEIIEYINNYDWRFWFYADPYLACRLKESSDRLCKKLKTGRNLFNLDAPKRFFLVLFSIPELCIIPLMLHFLCPNITVENIGDRLKEKIHT